MKKNSRRGKTRVSKIAQWMDRFRAIWVFKGIARRNRRKKKYQEKEQLRLLWNRQYSIDKGRNKAKTKARNRRNRKATRALHQMERRRA